MFLLNSLGTVGALFFLFYSSQFFKFIMSKVFAEHNFFLVFKAFGMYFLDQIRARNWDYLLHANTYELYIPTLVQEYNDGFSENNIDRNQGIIEVSWRGEMKILHLQTISELTVFLLWKERLKNRKT